MSITERIIPSTRRDAYWVKYKAGNRLKGIIITNPITVTSRDPTRNGRNPNCPEEGRQADEKRRFVILSKRNIGNAFMTSPRAIDNGKINTSDTEKIVHVPALYSFIFLNSIIRLFQFFQLCMYSVF